MNRQLGINRIELALAAILFVVPILYLEGAFAYKPEVTNKSSHEMPEEFQNVRVEEKLGQGISLNREFLNDEGQSVKLAEYFGAGKPVLLSVVYYECASLCNFHLNGLNAAFKKMKLEPGKDFEFVAVSMNHRENAELASAKKKSYLEEYGRPETAQGWHFLTGTEQNIKLLTDELGFKFKWNEDTQQFAHNSVAYVLTPEGTISRYLFGIEVAAKTMSMALVEASKGKVGDFVDQILLFCFQFDPTKNKYTLYAYNVMRAGAGLMVVFMAIFLAPVWFRSYRSGAEDKGEQ